MNVYAFDRDDTVDVNPPEKRDAVPLEWIRYLAHETEHEVWAIGNQRLKAEADIPGDEEAIELYEQRWGDVADHVDARTAPPIEERVIDDPDAPDPDITTAIHVKQEYGERLERHQRLRLLRRLIPDASRYVVIDNFYLGYLREWTHYYPWEFAEEVELATEMLDHSTDVPKPGPVDQ